MFTDSDWFSFRDIGVILTGTRIGKYFNKYNYFSKTVLIMWIKYNLLSAFFVTGSVKRADFRNITYMIFIKISARIT